MGQALYRKYRSKSLDEIVGQEHVTTTLKNALKAGRISHAYLLTGPRGVGKTSIARILAHEINGLAYDDQAHLDIIEIDAASNRRIDEIRDLRDRVSTAPSAAKYKVYIIDEVHMLTREAFNALLKTLEEPPAHVVFILATTEAHKLPETIISRTQRYNFRPAAPEAIVHLLTDIAKKEKIDIDQPALELIAQQADGSFRDSESLLDQASSTSSKVTRPDVERMLGIAPSEQIVRLQTALTTGDSASIVATLAELYANGYEAAMVSHQLGTVLRSAVLAGSTSDTASTLVLLQKLLDVPAARSPKLLLELLLLEHGLTSTAVAPQPADAPATLATPKPRQAANVQPAEQSQSSAPSATSKTTQPVEEQKPKAPIPVKPIDPTSTKTGEAVADGELWQQALNEIKKQYNTLYGIARMAQTKFDGHTLTLSFKFAFHQKRLNEAKNRKIFADVVHRLYGNPVEIICVVAEPDVAVSQDKPDVSAISNIFGGAELLES